jgi:predicted HAD superfamily Cof-like phosphohydrolase
MGSGRVKLRSSGRGHPGHGQLTLDPEIFVLVGGCTVRAEQPVPDTPGLARTTCQARTQDGSAPDCSGTGIPGTVRPGVRVPGPSSATGLSEVMLSVARFHQAFDLPRASRPTTDLPAALAKLRVDLLVEEVGEFADATTARGIVGIADALADVVYVAYGAAVTYGIDLDAALREVHRSNMSKLDEQGKPVYRDDGKVLKSARYTPPDIARVLLFQPPLPF